MVCNFENCTTELSQRTRGTYCQRHRRVLYTRKWNNEHKEYSANRYKLEKEQIRSRIKAIPKEKIAIKNKIWYQLNKDKSKELNSKWSKANPSKRAHTAAKYRAQKLKAIPMWLNKDHKDEINAFYKNRPHGYHVDHIVPLQGENVSGLHVPWNLQYLTISENCSKGNKSDV